MESVTYKLEKSRQGEERLLNKAGETYPEEVSKIKEFLFENVTAKNLTTHRYYYYSVRLRKSLELLKSNFMNPSKQELQVYLTALTNTMKDRTVVDYIDSYKRFQKWNNDGELPKVCKILQFKESRKGKEPDDLITPNEFDRLINNSPAIRDKALISLLWDSGARIGEILGLKRKDITFDSDGMEIRVYGKTGFRKAFIVGSSVMFLKLWLKQHPVRDQHAYVFCLINQSQIRTGERRAKRQIGDPMNYDNVRKVLRTAMAKAGMIYIDEKGKKQVTKRIHPHLFRHTRASILANTMPEAPLEDQLGWVHGSKQTRTYVHLSGKQQKSAVLKAFGIEREDVKLETGTKRCPGCGNTLQKDVFYCPFCFTDFPDGGERTVSQYREHIFNLADELKLSQLKESYDAIVSKAIDKKLESIFSKMDKMAIKKLLS